MLTRFVFNYACVNVPKRKPQLNQNSAVISELLKCLYLIDLRFELQNNRQSFLCFSYSCFYLYGPFYYIMTFFLKLKGILCSLNTFYFLFCYISLCNHNNNEIYTKLHKKFSPHLPSWYITKS